MASREKGRTAPDVRRGRRLASVIERLDRLRRTHLQAMTLGTADLRMLWLFTDREPRTLKQIAQELNLEQSTVNRQVNAAVAQGLLEKSRPPGGSAYEVVSTDAGHQAFEQDVQISLGGYESALMSLGEADAAVLLDLFDRFLHAYEELAPGQMSTAEPRH
ncbi:MarR family winged helix-turn-helix transcriptional regulator [Brachybacterium tyrofermentans]|uniref:MarR family winged helix-turn-helix transcriptional regulator n=1 Tax=Brachybacterium tyrofermentans TaxID=47848 RepID=UPI003FD495E1